VTRDEPSATQLRVLLKTATSKDAALTRTVLERAGMAAHACATVGELAVEIDRGVGALLIAEEVLGDPSITGVIHTLRQQPPWSDLPVLVLARTGADSIAVVEAMDILVNITVIERPIRVSALVSIVRSALRARRRQYELYRVLEGMHEADQRKTEFLATLAHELRNPLAPLSTALALLTRTSPTPEAARPYYAMMGRQVEHMVRLINDLMEISRITRGKIELQTDEIALDRVVMDAIEVSRPVIDAARHRLDVAIDDGRWIVRGDNVRLTQVFSNLLNNAAKYTPPGGRIDVRMERHSGYARVRVKDNGIGIPADMLDTIFGMFVQVSGTARAAQGGLGIGLTLVRSLVELHGGIVHARSGGTGLGSEFIVELPIVAAHRPASADDTPVVDRTALPEHFLVVDDNRDAADSLSELLRALGATTTVAYDAEQAIRLAKHVRPTYAILDLGMPGMDGCELATTLRRDPTTSGIVLFALTGWGQNVDRSRTAAAGFDRHFLKPLDIDELRSAVREARRS
jgi:signal transduction histidine kinase/CheY-like chemotaxis protein